MAENIKDNQNNEIPPKVDDSIIPIKLEGEMQSCYLDYAMSVIIGRALPDVRDGLKPVHRRVLYSMHELNNVHNKPYLKSARIVGDVIGKYHPHGDQAVYQTMVRMAQPFSMRYPLVDGQGNFGSIDGDNAAAMRYTEVRMDKITSEMLADLEKNTVDFVPNYDDKLKEPILLPARIPNLLVNGSQGIAVGMATHIPPHNLTEILDGVKAYIENPKITSEELLNHVKGPDFPTGAFILGKAGIKEAYTKGRGIIQVRARAEIEIYAKEKERIIVTEIPYLVNKAQLIIQIAELTKDKKIDGISDIRDESDRDGMRIVIEVRKGYPANIVMNNLFKFTDMQSSFGIIFLAIAHNVPKVLTLKEMLEHFVLHRKEVVIRRTQFELNKALEKAHILEGLKIAVENIDQVITLIKKANSPESAKEELKNIFSFSDAQAQAILEMRLQRLTGLERDKIISDYKEVIELIKKLKEILASEKLIYKIILDETEEIIKEYGDKRKTEIVNDSGEVAIEDIISDDKVIITISHNGYIKRDSVANYRSQRRGGRGVMGMTTREEDFVETIFSTSNHSNILFFTNFGKCYTIKVHEIPQASRYAKGTAIVNLLEMANGEKPCASLSIKKFEPGSFIILVTSKGIIKKMDVMNFEKVMRKGIIAIKLDNEEVIAAKLIKGKEEVFIGTKYGQSIRFDQEDLRDIGRVARGVRGIDLKEDDIAVGAEVLNPVDQNAAILTITEKGYGKRTLLSEYRVQGRGGSGIITINVTDKTGNVVSMKQVNDSDDIMIITTTGNIIRTNVKSISVLGRNTQGVRLIRIEDNELVTGVARVESDEDKNISEGIPSKEADIQNEPPIEENKAPDIYEEKKEPGDEKKE